MRFDLQDALLIIGVLAIECGVRAIYPPAALILLGLFAFAAVLLIESGKRKQKAK